MNLKTMSKNKGLKTTILLAIIILIIIPSVYAVNIHSFVGTFYPDNESMDLEFSYYLSNVTQEDSQDNESSYVIEFLNLSQTILKTYKIAVFNFSDNSNQAY